MELSKKWLEKKQKNEQIKVVQVKRTEKKNTHQLPWGENKPYASICKDL